MAQEENVLKIVKNILKDYRFALIGANAMNLWVDESKIRATQDLDFMVEAGEDDFVKIAKAFREAGFTAHLKFGRKEDPVPVFLHLNSNTMPPVDILIADKPWELSLLDNAVPLEDFDMKVSGPEHLILTKLYSSSEIDLIDIRNLVLFPVEDIDIERIKQLINKFFDADKLGLFLKAIAK